MLENNSSVKEMFSKPLTVLIIFGLLVGFSTVAVGAEKAQVHNLNVVDRVDKDGDGYISEFAVAVNLEDSITEKGELIGKYLEPFEYRGEPWFGVYLGEKRTHDSYSGEQHRPDIRMTPDTPRYKLPFKLEFDYDAVEKMSDSERPLLNGATLKSFQYVYVESDSTWDRISYKDEEIENSNYILDKPFKIESPENDKLGDVVFNSNPSGAEVYVNGEKKGTTPFTVQMPVDIVEREGPLNIRVEKDGYEKKLVKEAVKPSEQISYTLAKSRKPLIVDANVEDAIVKVNGQQIGETPIEKKYWVKEELDVTVEKEGYEDKSFKIKTPGKIDAEFDTESGESSGSNLNYDMINSLDYSLVNELPDLNSMFQARFNTSTDTIKSGESVTFDASPSYDIVSNITAYSWKIDGENVGTGKTFSYSFNKPGNYSVNLTAVNTQGTEAYTTSYVTVENVLPTPEIKTSQKEIETGSTATFDATGSKDTDGQIIAYNWKVDGSTVSQGASMSHTFSTEGKHTVTLEVTDSQGATETISDTIKVEKPNLKPQPAFTVSNNNPETGEVITLDASTSADPDGQVDTLSWNLGDGLSKSGQSIQHNYSQSGTYNIELNVVDALGARASVSKTVIVTGESKKASSSGKKDSSMKGGPSNESSNQSQEENISETENGSGEENTMNLLIRLIQSFF